MYLAGLLAPTGFSCRGQYISKTEKEKSLKSVLTDVTKTARRLEIPLQYSWTRKEKKRGGKLNYGNNMQLHYWILTFENYFFQHLLNTLATITLHNSICTGIAHWCQIMK